MFRYKHLVEMVKKRKMNGEATSQQPSEGGDENTDSQSTVILK
jgi:hypothetical protein